jgi:uncharacterized membrane protein
MSGRVFTRISALAAILALALAAPVLAQSSPTADAYGGQQGQVLGNFSGGGQNDVVPGPAQTAPGSGQAARPRTVAVKPVERGTTVAPAVVTKGSLPFTGFESGLVALAGLALLATGFAMRRASRTNA